MPAIHHYLSTINQMTINTDESALVNSDDYIAIRKEISRWFPSADWVKVKQLAESLGGSVGVNVITAVYYAVACVKVDGLSGLACGLEIIFAAMAVEHKQGAPLSEKHGKQLRWLFREIKDDVHALQLNRKDLPDLYRCDRVCTALNEMIGVDHPTYPPGLEVLQNTLSESIERLSLDDLEEPVPLASSTADPGIADGGKPWRWWLAAVILLIMLLILSTGMAAIYCQSFDNKLREITGNCPIGTSSPLLPNKSERGS